MSDGDGPYISDGRHSVYDGRSVPQLVADLSAKDPSRASIFTGLGECVISLEKMYGAIRRGASGTDAELLALARAAAQGIAPLANKPNLSVPESFLLTGVSLELIQVLDRAKVPATNPLRIQLEGVLGESLQSRTCD